MSRAVAVEDAAYAAESLAVAAECAAAEEIERAAARRIGSAASRLLPPDTDRTAAGIVIWATTPNSVAEALIRLPAIAKFLLRPYIPQGLVTRPAFSVIDVPFQCR